jgi:uncharacterized tellurite resistance protein B-like protein
MAMLDRLDRGERMRLMKFVCSFAWADLEIRPEEREFIHKMVARLALDGDDGDRVQSWLDLPPSPESIDPTLVPSAHRQVFIQAIKGVIAADGEIAPEEVENFRLFHDLVQ